MIDDPLNRLKVKRGTDLPHAKLNEAKVMYIRQQVERREELKAELKKLTNAEIAKSLNVHQRTVDRVTAGENWTHV